MYNLFSVEFILVSLFSLVAICIAIYIPGNVMLKISKQNFPKLTGMVMSIIVGTAFWVLQGFFFGFLGVRFLSYVYLLFFFIIWIRYFKRPVMPKFTKAGIFLGSIVLLGSVMQIAFGIFTGSMTPKGIAFCCVDVSDNLYFLALTHEIAKNFPPFEPGLHGIIVKNYHYLSNLFIAELTRVFFIPVNILQFQVSSIFLPIMLGMTLITFGYSVTKKIRYIFWLLIFVYFGGDFLWLLMVILQKGANYFSMGSLEDGTKFLSNPPRAFAMVQIFGGMTLLNFWLRNNERRLFTVIVGIVFGTLIGFKVYVGIFALLGLGALFIYWLFRREYTKLTLPLVSFVISLLLYLPVNSGAGGLYFTSFWFFENFIVQPYLQLERLELARRVFLDDGKSVKALAFELLYVVIVVFALFGSKILGLLQTKKTIKLFAPELHIFLIAGIIPSLVVGFFFQQTSGGSNTFNFIVNVFIVGSIYTAASAYWLTSFRKSIALTFGTIIICLTIPRVVFETTQNVERLRNDDTMKISNNQLDAYSFLSRQEKGLTLIDHVYFVLDQKSPYIGYFASQPMYLSGVQILQSHGFNVDNRLKIQETIMEGNVLEVARAIHSSSITYIILGPKTSITATNSAEFLVPIYKNKEVKVLKADAQKIDKMLEEYE